MRKLPTIVGWTWISIWAVVFFSAGFTNLFGLHHPWSALDNLGESAFTDWRVLLFWVALFPGVILVNRNSK